MASKVIFVTGANRGLGYSILEVAGTRDPDAAFILASRNKTSGEEAKEKLRTLGVKGPIDVVELDVQDDAQIIEAVKFTAAKHGKVDVLVNNAGILDIIQDMSLPTLRAATNNMLNVNLTSVACVTAGFQPIMRNSPNPKVINITSGLGSLEYTLQRKMARYAPYGASKVGMNGVTVHMQVLENDRIEQEQAEGKPTAGPKINYYSVAPGLLKTGFTHYSDKGVPPEQGAEVVVQLINDNDNQYPGGTQWEFVGGKMQPVPW